MRSWNGRRAAWLLAAAAGATLFGDARTRPKLAAFMGMLAAGALGARLAREQAPGGKPRPEPQRPPPPEFLSFVSHEIRAPLASIRGAAELLSAHFERLEPSRRRELLDAISESTGRVTRIADDLLVMAQRDEGHLELRPAAIDATRTVNDAIKALRLNGAETPIQIVAQPGLPPAWADPMRTLQIATNLLSNAVHYARAGSVVIATLTRDNNHIRIAVHNDGSGIAEAERSRLFTRYGRTGERSGDSTGLGLYIAKQLVEAMHGEISVDSEAGQNATFWFTLPVAKSTVRVISGR